MHSDIHHRLYTYRAAELHAARPHIAASAIRPPRTAIRTRVGWKMVEVGLRLAQSRPRPAAARTPRTA